MKKLLIYVVPVALVAAHASAAPSSGWGKMVAPDLAAGSGVGTGAPLVLVQRRGGGGGGGGVNRGNVNRANVNRGNFKSANFQRGNLPGGDPNEGKRHASAARRA